MIGRLETSVTGNLIFETGVEDRPPHWRKTGHIVLTPDEWQRLREEADRLLAAQTNPHASPEAS